MQPWYIATTPFGPADGDKWTGFVTWSGLGQLTELVSLDGMLCAPVLDDVEDHYWDHIVAENFMLQYFRDLPFLLGELAGREGAGPYNLLCVVRNPEAQPMAPEAGFHLLGYDLVDRRGIVSALSNCGGFPKVFRNSELNAFGLIASRERAVAIQTDLKREHPEEPHADCHVWAILRSDRLSRG